jgi:hypothetical protein
MSNPLLTNVKLPGRIFQLPSKGIFYNDKVLASHVINAEIEVKPLSALAELKLRSADMLFSGRALREICLECIPDILDPSALVSKDVDAIFCFLHIVTYGNEMNIKSIHDCQNRKVNSYNVNIESIIINPNNKFLDDLDVFYNLELSNKQKIKLKPVRFQDSINIIQLKQEIEKKMDETNDIDSKLMENAVVTDLMAVIESVEGIKDEKLIREWVKLLPKKYFSEIVDYTRKINEWGFNLTVELTCKDCNEKYPHNLELDPINFFSG